MKCINCNTDNNLQDRTANQGRCKNCDRPFAFEPTAMGDVKFTDGFFQKVMGDISINNTLFFTPKQLLYFLDKKLKRKAYLPVIALLFIYLFFTGFFTIWLGGILASIFRIPLVWSSGPLVVSLITILTLFKATKDSNKSYADRQNSATGMIIIGAIVLVGGIFTSITIFKAFPIFVIATILGVSSIYLGITARKNKIIEKLIISRQQSHEWLSRWRYINGDVDRLLPALPTEANSTPVNPEITNYSFDRVVVTDTASVAQFLIANNFHFENNCAVLSITGYPQEIFDTVLEMLKRNQDLKVYAFHDATPQGVSLVYKLRSNPRWFADSSATIYDLGILPRQVLNQPKISVFQYREFAQEARRLPPEVKDSLSPDEIAWLESGNYVELESFPPQRLLQFVTRGINLTNSNDSDVLVPLVGYSSDVGYIYAVDSFG